ncbi:MAG: hypothetical protein J6Y60_02610 [Treponema sp.]|nr:hypothetical protein [Treponema sp.]
MEYASEYTYFDDVPQVSANGTLEIRLYLVNPKGIPILQKIDGSHCFSFAVENGESPGTNYSEEAMDADQTSVRIKIKLDDNNEGQKITLSGCLWPENKTSFTETQLKESYPETFYSTTFVQNTPPDNIKDLQRAPDFFPETKKAYISFKVPKQDQCRNKNSTYEVKYYFREDNGSMSYKGSRILTLADNKNPDSGSDTFMYYFEEQTDDILNRYEYTVQETGPHGLKAELRATDKALGPCILVEPVVTVNNEFNGLKDEDDYLCIEVPSNDSTVSFTAIPGQEGDTLTVTDNGTVMVPTGNLYTVSGIGQHQIIATSSRTDAFPVTVEKKIRIVKTPEPATFTFENLNGNTDSNGYEYIEVETASSTAAYTISPTEEGTSVSGSIDGTSFSETDNSQTGTLDVNSHTLTAVIHKLYCQTVTTTRKIKVAKQLDAPVYEFTTNGLSGNKISGYETIEVPASSGKESYKIKPASADSGAKISATAGSVTFSATTQKSGQLGIGEYTFTVTVNKQYMTSRTFTRKIKVVLAIQEPNFVFTPGLTSESGDKWVEVPATNHDVTCKITANANGESLAVKHNGSTINTPANFTLSSLGDHTFSITVTKTNYKSRTFTKTIKIVEELQAPTIKFYTDSSHNHQATAHSAPEDQRFLLYDSYDIDLDGDGNGWLYYTTTSPDGATVKVTDKKPSPNVVLDGKLVIGPHLLFSEVSKTNYKTRTFPSSGSGIMVYVQGKLKPPTFKPDGTKISTDEDGTEHWQFSYKKYEEMPIDVTPGNTGNTVELHVDGQLVTTASIGHNTAGNVTAIQSREYCVSRVDTSKWMSVTIKPITLKYKANTYGELAVFITGLEASTGDKISIRGGISINNRDIFHYKGSAFNNVTVGDWSILKDGDYSYQQTFSEPSDTITVKLFDKFRRDKDGGDPHIIDGSATKSESTTLSYVRKGWNNKHGEAGSEPDAGSNWTFICRTISGEDGKIRLRIKFEVSD